MDKAVTSNRGRRPKLSQDIINTCVARLQDGSADPRLLCKTYKVSATTLRAACKALLNIESSLIGKTPVPNHTGYYADDAGNIYSNKQGFYLKKLKPSKSGKQLKVAVIKDGDTQSAQVLLKDLVYITFKGEIPADSIVVNIDNDYENNHPDNLTLINRTEDTRSMFSAKGESHGRSKLTEDKVRLIHAYSANKGISEIARIMSVHPTTIKNILLGRLWPHVNLENLPTITE